MQQFWSRGWDLSWDLHQLAGILAFRREFWLLGWNLSQQAGNLAQSLEFGLGLETLPENHLKCSLFPYLGSGLKGVDNLWLRHCMNCNIDYHQAQPWILQLQPRQARLIEQP